MTKNFLGIAFLTLTAAIIAGPLALADEPEIAYCFGAAAGVRVNLQLTLGENGYPPTHFELSVLRNGQRNPQLSSGTPRVSGGDGMNWADLVVVGPNGRTTSQARFNWWVIPSITPNIRLANGPELALNCQDLWPRR